MAAKKLSTPIKTGQRLPAMLTTRTLQELVIDWSDDTIRRKIKDKGFPGKQEEPGGPYVFATQDVRSWFKKNYGVDL